MMGLVLEVELHDEVAEWLLGLEDAPWKRAVVVIDRLAEQGPTARMPLSRSLGERLFELRFTLGLDVPADHLPVHLDWRDRVANDLPQAAQQRTLRDHPSPPSCRGLRSALPMRRP
jgi:hypothetical protein